MEAGVNKCLTEDMTNGVCVEYIANTTCFQAVCHIGKALVQELVELIILDAVVLNGKTQRAFERYTIRRIGQNQVCTLAVHKGSHILFGGRISTIQLVPAHIPHIATLHKAGLLQRSIEIELIILAGLLISGSKEIINLGRIKTGKGHIEVGALQICNQQSQLVVIPFTADLVEGNV